MSVSTLNRSPKELSEIQMVLEQLKEAQETQDRAYAEALLDVAIQNLQKALHTR